MKFTPKPRVRRNSFEINMTEGPLLGKLIRFSIPLALSGILQLLFNAADIVVVGRFAGNHALAAVGSTGALNMLIVNLFMGLSIGVNVLVARYYGAGQRKDLHETVHTSILTAAACGIVLIFLGMLLSRPLLQMMETPEDVIDHSVLYMRIIFAGMPAYAIQLSLCHTTRGGGYPAPALLFVDRRSNKCTFKFIFRDCTAYGGGWRSISHGYQPVCIRGAGAIVFNSQRGRIPAGD